MRTAGGSLPITWSLTISGQRRKYSRCGWHPKPEHLVGREKLLAELHVRLTSGDDLRPRMVVLQGLGGAGKTSLAVEYAHRHLPGAGVAWQFPAEDPAVLVAGFEELAAQLGARDPDDTRDPVASVHAVLAKFQAGWLLIFDNAVGMASVEAFLPPAGPGRVLITSQNPNWPGQVLDVPVLDPEAAAGFLVSRTGDPDRRAALDLASELGGLPLALEQAAAYMVAAGKGMADYMASFRQRRADMLDRGEPSGYGKTVATTWSLAFGELERFAPSGVGLLRLVAFCAPEAIPLGLLLQAQSRLVGGIRRSIRTALVPLLTDSVAADAAIAALRRYSLVTPAGHGAVSVHRLVQVVTQNQMPTDVAGQWRRAAAALIESAIPDDAIRPETWPVFAALLPHAQIALADDSAAPGPARAFPQRIWRLHCRPGAPAAHRERARAVAGS